VPRRPHSMLFLLWSFPWRSLLWFWWFTFYVICFYLL
jgi:hypothetical protein